MTGAGIKVTFAAMISCGPGSKTVIGIYRGMMAGPIGKRFIRPHSCLQFMRVEVERLRPYAYVDLIEQLQRQYSTPDWPAADWKK
jgi:hypothetical protein